MSIFSLCSPALLYLILSIICLIIMIYLKVNMITIAMKDLLVAIWTWFLNFLCSKGHIGISWFLVIIPMVVFALCLIVVSNIMGCIKDQNNEMFTNVDCMRTPWDPGCPPRCDMDPTDDRCPEDCEKNPEDPRCPDCNTDPYDYRCPKKFK